MVENVGVSVGISPISHSIPEIQCTSGLMSAILNFGSRPTSDNVGSVTSELGMVENVWVAVGISLISLSIRQTRVLPVCSTPF